MTDPSERYPTEVLSDADDDGQMPENVDALREAVVGHRIVKAEQTPVAPAPWTDSTAFVITLDTGRQVQLFDTDDCCAYTELESFLLRADRIDHIITGVGTTDGYETWHIYADMGDVLEMKVGWSAGNVGYYGYGFEIKVQEP